MKNYRKKPVTIQATLFDGTFVSAQPILDLMASSGAYWSSSNKLHIPTLEGVMTASAGDYIIRGIQGEFYPCKPDIFKDCYEEVEDGTAE